MLTVQNLSLTADGARAMTKAGVAPVIVRFLRGAVMKEDHRTLVGGSDEAVDGEHLDRNGKIQATERQGYIDYTPCGKPP